MTDKQKYFRRVIHESALLPGYIAGSVADIDVSELKKLRIGGMILDIDDTLMKRRGHTVDDRIAANLKKIRTAGISLVIGSNTNRDIAALADSIEARVIDKKWWHNKPMKRFYAAILGTLELPPDRVVMVGDRSIKDVLGANRSGIRTILVLPVERRQNRLSRRYRTYLLRHSVDVER